MALCTKLLQGISSEWALVKRHSSEDVFGVQIAGAHVDTMSKCTQLLNDTCDIDFIDINVGCPIDLIFEMVSFLHGPKVHGFLSHSLSVYLYNFHFMGSSLFSRVQDQLL